MRGEKGNRGAEIPNPVLLSVCELLSEHLFTRSVWRIQLSRGSPSGDRAQPIFSVSDREGRIYKLVVQIRYSVFDTCGHRHLCPDATTGPEDRSPFRSGAGAPG